MRDPYKLLNVPYDVTASALKARYHEFAKKLHADFGGSDEMMKLINEARDQIRFNIENGIAFDPLAEQAATKGPESEPRPEEQTKHDDRNSRSARDSPRDGAPEEPEPKPQWGPDAHTWDIGGGTYRTSERTYSNRPYFSSRGKWTAAGIAALLICIALISRVPRPVVTTVGPGSQLGIVDATERPIITPAPQPQEVAPPPMVPAPPPATSPPPVAGYFAVRSLGEVFQIIPGGEYGLDLLPGDTLIVILSGQVALFAPDGNIVRACSADPISYMITNPVSPASSYVRDCFAGPTMLQVVGLPPEFAPQASEPALPAVPLRALPIFNFRSVANGRSAPARAYATRPQGYFASGRR